MEEEKKEVEKKETDVLFDKGWNMETTPSSESKVTPEPELKIGEGQEKEEGKEVKETPESKPIGESDKGKGQEKEEGKEISEPEPKGKDKEGKGQEKETAESYEQQWKSQQGIVKSLNKKIAELEKQLNPNKEKTLDNDNLTTHSQGQVKPSDKKTVLKSFYEAVPSLKTVQDQFGDELPEAIVDIVHAAHSDVSNKIAQIINTLSPLFQERFEMAIRQEEPEFNKYRDSGELIEWIEGLPDFEKEIYKKKYDNSTADEAIKMIRRFKKEKGYSDSDSIDTNKERGKADKEKIEKELKSMTGIKNIIKPVKPIQPSNEKTFESGWNLI